MPHVYLRNRLAAASTWALESLVRRSNPRYELPPRYVSEARDQSAAGGVKPKLYNQVRAPSPHGAKRDGGS